VWLSPRLTTPLRVALVVVLIAVLALVATGRLMPRTPLQDLVRLYPSLEGVLTLRDNDHKARDQPSGAALMALLTARWRGATNGHVLWPLAASGQEDGTASRAAWDEGRLIIGPNGHGPWQVPVDPTWTEDPFADPEWVAWYQSLDWLRPLADGYTQTHADIYAQPVATYVMDWLAAHPDAGAGAPLSALSQRLDNLIYVFDTALGANLAEPDIASFVRALSDHGLAIEAGLASAEPTPAERADAFVSLYQLARLWPDLRLAGAWRQASRGGLSELIEQSAVSLNDSAAAAAVVQRLSDANQYLGQFGEPFSRADAALVASILPGGPPGYQFCGHEGQTCELDLAHDVAFGLGGQFNYGFYGPGTVACTAEALGEVVPGFAGARNCYVR
jgi:hypothetical protein